MRTCWHFALLALILITAAAAAGQPPELRVCADPNNLPFSNRQQQGLENELARLLAKDLGRTLRFTWWPQRRGFIRNTLKAKTCDVVMGVPEGYELAATTRPYYRSTYVFLSRRDRALALRSFDDSRLKDLRIGVHVVGDDFSDVPPALALARRGVVGNLKGYSIYGDYRHESPPAELIHAVARGDVDLAIVWGPLAGYFAQRAGAPLDIVPVTPAAEPPGIAFTFAISMAVRRDDQELLRILDDFITRRRADIDRLLQKYGVPRVPPPASEPRAQVRP